MKVVRSLSPTVEVEEDLYTYEAPNNGASPLWCMGSTSLVRIGDRVFASGGEIAPEAKPLNNWRPALFLRDAKGWRRIFKDEGRTREPCPIGGFPDGRIYMTVNRARTAPETYDGPAQPGILEFQASSPETPPRTMLPAWDGDIAFHEHSYRSFAVDAARREFILFWNTAYDRSYWTFRDSQGHWSAQGQLIFPWGADYEKPCAIRLCYPNVAIRDRAVHFFGMSDIVEPNSEWRNYKRQVTGREWDYEMRRLFYAATPDIAAKPFSEWMEITSLEKTAGHTMPCDLALDRNGGVHLLWREISVNKVMREKYFPGVPLTHSLHYARLQGGKVVSRKVLAIGGEGAGAELPTWARFQATPDGRLFAFYSSSDEANLDKGSLKNYVVEMIPDGTFGQPVPVPLRYPFNPLVFTATPRAGSPESNCIELLGECREKPLTMRYARVRLCGRESH